MFVCGQHLCINSFNELFYSGLLKYTIKRCFVKHKVFVVWLTSEVENFNLLFGCFIYQSKKLKTM